MKDIRYINGKAYLSTKDAALRCGKTPATIAKQCRAGLLDAQKVRGAWFVAETACPASSKTSVVVETNSVSETSTRVTKISKRKKTIYAPRVIVTLKKPLQPLYCTVGNEDVMNTPLIAPVTAPVEVIPVVAHFFVSTISAISLSMIIGVILLISIFWVGELPFMSQPLAVLSRIDQPIRSLGQSITLLHSRFSTKTDALVAHNLATVTIGVASLGQEIESLKRESKEKIASISARPSMLARAASTVPRISFREKVTETTQLMAAAFMSLYQFETINTSIAHTTNSTWGCTFGFGDCPTKKPVPLRGVTVYDIETKRIHCLQVMNGQATSTPGRCAIEDRR